MSEAKAPYNNALKPTRSAFLPLSGPRGLVQCCTGLKCSTT